MSGFWKIPQKTCPTAKEQAWLLCIFSVLLTRRYTNISITLLVTNTHQVRYQDQREGEKIVPSSKPFEQVHLLHTNNKRLNPVSYGHSPCILSNLFAQAMTFCLPSYWKDVYALPPHPAALHSPHQSSMAVLSDPLQSSKDSWKSQADHMEEGSQCESLLVNRQWECKESSWEMSQKNKGDGSRYLGISVMRNKTYCDSRMLGRVTSTHI